MNVTSDVSKAVTVNRNYHLVEGKVIEGMKYRFYESFALTTVNEIRSSKIRKRGCKGNNGSFH